MKKSTKKTIQRAEVGGAIAAAVLAAAAGAYFMSDKKNQAKMKAWAKKARIEVAKKAKVAKKLGEAEYDRIVDQVVKNYGPLEDLSARDVMMMGKELKAQWGAIQKHAQKFAGTSAKKGPAKKKSAKRKKASSPRKAAKGAKKTVRRRK
jgi:hypothetical protein